jgi:hypothetical protein
MRVYDRLVSRASTVSQNPRRLNQFSRVAKIFIELSSSDTNTRQKSKADPIEEIDYLIDSVRSRQVAFARV